MPSIFRHLLTVVKSMPKVAATVVRGRCAARSFSIGWLWRYSSNSIVWVLRGLVRLRANGSYTGKAVWSSAVETGISLPRRPCLRPREWRIWSWMRDLIPGTNDLAFVMGGDGESC